MNQISTNDHLPLLSVPFAIPISTRIAIISASWHLELVDRASYALVSELERCRLSKDQMDHFKVPGAFEIPLLAKKLAKTGRYDAIIACALVVDGGIYRHEFVAAAVIEGLMRVQLDTEVPVFSAVLTPQHFHEHEEHLRFFSEHLVKKGVEVAQACATSLAGLRAFEEVTA